MPKWRKSRDEGTTAWQDEEAALATDAADWLSEEFGVAPDQMPSSTRARIDLIQTITDALSSGSPSDSERFVALLEAMDQDPTVLRIGWLRRSAAGWDHASQAVRITPAELLKTQARSNQHNFVQRWEEQFSALSSQDLLYEGFTRIGFDGWIVGYAESGEDWAVGPPCNLRMDLLADETAAQLENLTQTAMSDAAFVGLENMRGVGVYQCLFRPLGISAIDVFSTGWGREGLQVGSLMLDWGYCLARAQRDLADSA
jgi:hypothetical protein